MKTTYNVEQERPSGLNGRPFWAYVAAADTLYVALLIVKALPGKRRIVRITEEEIQTFPTLEA